MKIKFIIPILITIILFSHFAFSQQRGVRVTKTNANGQSQEVQLYDGSYALIIGNSEYSEGWDRLSGVKSDVVEVRNILQKHGFQVEVEENLVSQRFETRIKKFINDYGYDRNNRLIIYYAGHGFTLKSAGGKRELGYVIPSDTPLPTKNAKGFRQKAVDMYAMQNFAKQIQAKHALFIFDSCFSGKLFALRSSLKIPPFIYEKVDYPVRQFITAGDETQTVPDESIFRKTFIRGLEGDADRNNDGYIVGTELADYLKEKVTNYTNRQQTPQYGKINDIDLDRGDFVFVVPKGITRPLSNESEKIPSENTANNSKTREQFYASAYLSFQKGNYEYAFAEANEAIIIYPDYAQAYVIRAMIFHLQNKHIEASADATTAIDLNLQNEVPYLVRGSSNNVLGNYKQGLSDFNVALKLNPQSGAAFYGRGTSYSNTGNNKKGIEDYNRSIRLGFKDARVFYNRGTIYAKQNDLKKALEDFNKAIEINPQLAEAYNNRAIIYKRMGKTSQENKDRKKYYELITKRGN